MFLVGSCGGEDPQRTPCQPPANPLPTPDRPPLRHWEQIPLIHHTCTRSADGVGGIRTPTWSVRMFTLRPFQDLRVFLCFFVWVFFLGRKGVIFVFLFSFPFLFSPSLAYFLLRGIPTHHRFFHFKERNR